MTDDTHVIPAGRPVRLEPTPPGFWMTVLGVVAAGLAPLFGFLIGTTMGPTADAFLQPLYWGLFLGVVVGGAGVLVAAFGARRWWLHAQHTAPEAGADVDAGAEEGEVSGR